MEIILPSITHSLPSHGLHVSQMQGCVCPHIHTHISDHDYMLSHTKPTYSEKLLSSFNQLSYLVKTSSLLILTKNPLDFKLHNLSWNMSAQATTEVIS